MLHVEQAARKQTGARQQNDRQCRLHDDERFLRERRLVARAAIGAAQGFRRIGVRGEPRGREPKSTPVNSDTAKANASTGIEGVASIGT